MVHQTTGFIRSGLARKIGLIQLVPLCGAILAALLFGLFLAQSAPVPTHVNLAGRQRMLAVQLGDWARLVVGGRSEDRLKLRELVASYDRSLAALERGGEIDGLDVVPLTDAVRAELSRLRTQWDRVRPRLLVIADRQAESPEVDRAASDLASDIDTLRASAEELTAALVARAHTLRRRMLALFTAGVGLNLVLAVLGFWYSRRYIVGPILQLDAAVRRISEGDYSIRVVCTTRDELRRLTETFNEMAARIHGALAAMDHRRQQAEAFIEDLPVATVLMDAHMQVVRTNRACRAILGLPENAVQGRPLEDVFPHRALHDRLRATLKGHDVVHGLRVDIETLEGVRPLRITAVSSRLVDADDQLVVVVEDLTEETQLRAHAQASELSFRTLIDQAPDSIAVHRDGRFVYVNPAMVRRLGYQSEADLVGQPVSMTVHSDDREVVAERIRTMRVTSELAPPKETRLLCRAARPSTPKSRPCRWSTRVSPPPSSLAATSPSAGSSPRN